MNAPQPYKPALQVTPLSRQGVSRQGARRSRRQPQLRRHPHQAVATEVGIKLVVNLVLAIASISALVKLLPYNLNQQTKLREITTEVAAVEGRVDRVQTDFNRHFDPQQATSVMQEQTSRVQPGQRPIVWVNPSRTDPAP